VEEQLPFESELIARIGWLVRLRWIAIAGLASAIGLAALWLPHVLPLPYLLGVTAVIAFYNLLFSLYLRTLRRDPSVALRMRYAPGFAFVQITLDLIALAAILHFSGGVENPMVLFFVFHVIIASILLSPRVSYFMAAFASFLFLGVAGLEYAGVLPHYHLPLFTAELFQEPLYLLISASLMTLTLLLVTYLTTSITVQLRARDRALLESNMTCQLRSSELQELNEQLQRIDQERTRFIVLVTHELRAPINTVYSALELALSGYASPEKTDEVLHRAQRRVTELLDLIRDLLDLAQAREQASQRIQVDPIQMAAALREVVEFMQVEAEEKGIALTSHVAANLPPVCILPEQAKLIWTNLISNAIKYTPSGGSIQVSLTTEEGRVRGMIRDTGIGIAAEDLPQVFGEFFRASNARSISPHGTGVGLAVVHRIIDNWGGRIWVESELGVGSAFSFVLPAAETQARGCS
jgi:signal transduction histidine kinase